MFWRDICSLKTKFIAKHGTIVMKMVQYVANRNSLLKDKSPPIIFFQKEKSIYQDRWEEQRFIHPIHGINFYKR